MKELCVSAAEAGQRLDKYLARYLPEAEKSFLYKMLRKKNITLNGKKAQGGELLREGDLVRVWFSDETYEKFAGGARQREDLEREYPCVHLDILYEDEHVLLVNKPAGMLSQKASGSDRSLCEYLIGYMLRTGQIGPEELLRFRPSVCSRLDRNTSGIVACGKTMAGLAALSELFRERTLHKYYVCLVDGIVKEHAKLDGYLIKDESTNRVTVSMDAGPEGKRIITEYRPLMTGENLLPDHRTDRVTALEVLLVTGRSHQIRAHLASDGHPIIGDPKYAPERLNTHYRRTYGIRRQLLHCARLEMPELDGVLAEVSGKTFTAPVPGDFLSILPELGGMT